MISQNPDAVSEKIAKMGFCPLISFRVHWRTSFLLPMNLYVVWQRFEKIGAETVGGESVFGKKTRRKIQRSFSSSVKQRATVINCV